MITCESGDDKVILYKISNKYINNNNNLEKKNWKLKKILI